MSGRSKTSHPEGDQDNPIGKADKKRLKEELLKRGVPVLSKPLTLIFAYDYAACLEYADKHGMRLVDWIFCHSEQQLDEYRKEDSKFVFLKNWQRGREAAFIKRVETIEASNARLPADK